MHAPAHGYGHTRTHGHACARPGPGAPAKPGQSRPAAAPARRRPPPSPPPVPGSPAPPPPAVGVPVRGRRRPQRPARPRHVRPGATVTCGGGSSRPLPSRSARLRRGGGSGGEHAWGGGGGGGGATAPRAAPPGCRPPRRPRSAVERRGRVDCRGVPAHSPPRCHRCHRTGPPWERHSPHSPQYPPASAPRLPQGWSPRHPPVHPGTAGHMAGTGLVSGSSTLSVGPAGGGDSDTKPCPRSYLVMEPVASLPGITGRGLHPSRPEGQGQGARAAGMEMGSRAPLAQGWGWTGRGERPRFPPGSACLCSRAQALSNSFPRTPARAAGGKAACLPRLHPCISPKPPSTPPKHPSCSTSPYVFRMPSLPWGICTGEGATDLWGLRGTC